LSITGDFVLFGAASVEVLGSFTSIAAGFASFPALVERKVACLFHTCFHVVLFEEVIGSIKVKANISQKV